MSRKILRMLLSIFIIIPLLASVLLYFLQDNLIFIRPPIDEDWLQYLKNQYADSEVQITMPDQVILHGWLIKKSVEKQSPLLMYFGGNAEEVSSFLWEDIEQFKGWSVLLVNYRGYGLSQGQPSETHLLQDAVFLYDTFSKRKEIDNTKIVAFGRSLGTGVAVHLASQRALQGVILVSPYDSIESIAQEIYFFVPVKFLLKHHFNSLNWAPAAKTRLLALIGTSDNLISPKHSWRLIQAWGGKSEVVTIEGRGHNDVHLGTGYWESISAFLEKIHN